MADNVPVHNKLTVRLANLIDDPVTGGDNGIAAATDGKLFSASIRNQRLHEGYSWIVSELVGRLGLDVACGLLADSITTQNVASTSASGDTVNKDYLYPVKLVRSTGSIYSLHIKSELDADFDRFLDNGFAIDGNKLYVYQRNSGTGLLPIVAGLNVTLHYLKADRLDATTGSDVAVNTAPDTTLNSRWHELALLFAAWRLCVDKGAAEWIEKGQVFRDRMEAYLPQAPKVNG